MRITVVVDSPAEYAALRRLLDPAGTDITVCVTTIADLPGAAAGADLVLRTLRPRPQPPVDAPPLSARERQVLAAIADGYTHAQIARRLTISTATVDTYVARIRTKLRVGNKAELTRAALGLLAPPPRAPHDAPLEAAS